MIKLKMQVGGGSDSVNTYYNNVNAGSNNLPEISCPNKLCTISLKAATTSSNGATTPAVQVVTTTTDKLVHSIVAWNYDIDRTNGETGRLNNGIIWIATSGTLDLSSTYGIVITKTVNSNQIVYTIRNNNHFETGVWIYTE